MRTAGASAILALLLTLLAAGDSPGVLFSQAPGEVLLYSEDFEDGQAQDWELGSGWQVEFSGTRHVLAGQDHNWATYMGAGWLDYRVCFQLRLLQGGIHLNVRHTQGEQGGRYFVDFSKDRTSLNKQVATTFSHDLDTDNTPHALDQWYEIEIDVDGSRIQVKVDDSPVLDYIDPTPLLFGSISFETLDNSEAKVDDITVYGPPAPSAGTWVWTGGPPGGLGYDVRFWPPDKDVIFVTDGWAGVNVSEDGGRTWSPSNEGITTRKGATGDSIPVFSLTIDPNDPNIIWVGTQNVRGVYKSTDRGRTWIAKTNGINIDQGLSIRGFTVDPRSSDIVYAQGEISSFAWTRDGEPLSGKAFDLTQGVVYKTTDGGENWVEIWRGYSLARYMWIDPAPDPREPDVLYVSTGIFDRESANTDVAANEPGGVGILKSTDGGATWQELNEANGLDNLYFGSLFMHPEDPDTLLAAEGNNSWNENGGVYLTHGGGERWSRTLPIEDGGMDSVEICLSLPDTAPEPGYIAYAGSAQAVYRSEDGGGTWELVAGGDPGGQYWGPPGVRAGFPIDFQCDFDDPDRLMVNNYGGGNYESLDGGRTWRNASQGYTGAQMRGLTVDRQEPARVYASGRSGNWVSEDGGETWRGLAFGWAPPEPVTVTIDPGNPRHLLAAMELDGRIWASSNGGLAWKEVYKNLHMPDEPGYEETHGYWAIEFAPSDPESKIVYAGIRRERTHIGADTAIDSYGMYKSTDGGATWQEINDADDNGPTADKSIMDIAVHPSNANTVYAAAYGAGVYKTTDGGASWHLTGPGPLCTKTYALEIDPDQPETVYAGCREGGVYKTINGGLTWVPSSLGMNPNATIREIVVDPTSPQTIYAGSENSGVLRSEDGGQSWQAINDGLTNREVQTLAISADGNHLYAGTEGAGVFRLDIGVRPVAPAESIFDQAEKGTWTKGKVEAGDVGKYSSISSGFWPGGDTLLSYFDASQEDLELAICDSAATGCDEASDWSKKVTVDQEGSVGWHASMATAGGRPLAAISYFDASNQDLKVAMCDPGSPPFPTCEGAEQWTKTIVDDGVSTASYTDIAITPDAGFAISYNEDGTNLKVALCDPGAPAHPTCTDKNDWTKVTVDSEGDVGMYTSITTHGGLLMVSYYDDSNNDLKVAMCDGGAPPYPTCEEAEHWTKVVVDNGGDVGQYSSIETTAQGTAISYYDADEGDLKVAVCDYAESGCDDTGDWTKVTVDTEGNVGAYTSMSQLRLPVPDPRQVGLGPVVSYYDASDQRLKLAWCYWERSSHMCRQASDWAQATVDAQEQVGSYTSIDPFVRLPDSSVKISYRQEGASLKFATGLLDADEDGVYDQNDLNGDGDFDDAGDVDNCPTTSNPTQADADSDGAGDACDVCTNDHYNDADNDGICAGSGFLPPKAGDNDNCPTVDNPGQEDGDADGIGDACEEAAGPVGGIAELPNVVRTPAGESASWARNYIALAALAATTLGVLATGAWHARRRWLR